MISNEQITMLLNDFATRSLRDVADQDYISARMSYRVELREPFLWSSLQAIEKYLKAILLFNGKSSKGMGHDLDKALQAVKKIKDIGFNIPDDVSEFISYLNQYGANRYLEYPTHLRREALLSLDHSIWHIRRYCFYMRGELANGKGEKINLLPINVKKVLNSDYIDYPHKYRLWSGYLEEIMRKKKESATHLIWHNFYFGRRKRNVIKKYKWHVSSTNPTLTMHPEIFPELDKLVKLSKETRAYFTKKSNPA